MCLGELLLAFQPLLWKVNETWQQTGWEYGSKNIIYSKWTKFCSKTIHGIMFWNIILEYIPKGSNFSLTKPMLFQMRAGNHLVIWRRKLFDTVLPFCFLEWNSVELYTHFLGPYRLRTLLLDVSRLSSFHSVRLQIAPLCFPFCYSFWFTRWEASVCGTCWGLNLSCCTGMGCWRVLVT